MLNRISNKISRVKKEATFRVFPQLTPIVKQNRNIIYMYHGVDTCGNTEFNTRHTSSLCFEKQIAFFQKYCNIVSVEEFFEERFIKEKPNIALTFDDGYLNNFLYAKPILEKYRAKATFYITGINQTEDDILWADFINIFSALNNVSFKIREFSFRKDGATYRCESGESIYDIVKNKYADYDFKTELYSVLKNGSSFKKNKHYDDYWRLMTDEQIKQAAASDIIDIGSHGFYHNNLGTVSLQNAVDELVLSKKYLESLIQRDIGSIAYPDGSYSRELIGAAYEIGFKHQLATDSLLHPEDSADFRIKSRKGIYSCDSCGNQIM